VKAPSLPIVVLDIGGVLVDWDPRHLYRKLTPDEEAIEAFLSEVCTMEWNEEQDAGRPFSEGVRERIARFPAHEAWIRAYQERWPEMLAGAFDEAVGIFQRLLERGPVYALTNWSAETWPIARARFPFLDSFAGVLVSGEEGLAKPDPRFYRLLLERYSLDPAQLLFVDDNRRNVDAARALGIDAIVHRDADTLRADLRARGLLSD